MKVKVRTQASPSFLTFLEKLFPQRTEGYRTMILLSLLFAVIRVAKTEDLRKRNYEIGRKCMEPRHNNPLFRLGMGHPKSC